MAFVSRVVEHVFGSDFIKSGESSDLDTNKFGSLITTVSNQLQFRLHGVNASSHEAHKVDKTLSFDQEDGRIGNPKVSLDLLELSHKASSYDSFKIIGVSHFGTVKTNCGVCRGKWQYEVLLLSTGVMQIGWATFNSKFGSGQGVGDTPDSYAYDGSRVRKWNVIAEAYGEKWEEDDVIGCCIDLDEGFVEFYRNGRSMGVAFKKIQMGAGIVYFPTISLQQKEGLIANFGSTPLCYSVPGFHPIHEPPHEDLASVAYLLDSTSKLLTLMDSHTAPEPVLDNGAESHEAVLLEVGKILVSNICTFLPNPYVMETKFIPFIRGLCDSENIHAVQGQVRPSARITASKSITACMFRNRKLITFLDIMWAFSEKNDLKIWTSTLVSRLSSKFQHNVRPLVLEFSHQRDAILVLHGLVRHRNLRHYLLNHILFDGIRLPWFTNIKVSSLESNTCWGTEPLIEINRRAYVAAVGRISSAMNSLEEMQVDLLLTLMDSTDGIGVQPSSRKIFLNKFRTLRRQFYALFRIDPLKSPSSPLFLVWPFFLRLLRVLELLWEKEMDTRTPDVVPSTKFYDGSISYYDIDRLGGVLLYLLKTFFSDLEQRLGISQLRHVPEMQGNGGVRSVVDSSTLAGPVNTTNLTTRIFDIFDDVVQIEIWNDHQSPVGYHSDDNQIEEPVETNNFLSEILDSLVLFYYISTKTHSLTESISLSQRKIEDVVQSLHDLQDAMKCFHASGSAKQLPDTLKTMETSYTLLLETLNQTTAHLITLNAMRYPNRHSWLFKVIFNTMKASAEDVHLFHFVPEFYLESMVAMLKQLSSEGKPTLATLDSTSDREELMLDIVQFICDHIDDQRVRIAKAKDTLLLALLDIVTTPNLLEVLHQVPAESQLNMVRFLIQPYENRAWANSNWILVRIWHGSPRSFACGRHWSAYLKYKLRPRPMSYPINPLCLECDPYPSPILQNHIQNILIDEPDVTSAFLNSVLNQLNWAFSEFIGMLQELQNVSNRQERVLVESRQLKICATCFDLTLALLRVLEMVSTLALPVFVGHNQPNAHILLSRLCQLLCQVLNRASSQDGCFHHITTLEIPGLENVDHFPILTAVCGILLAILKDDMKDFLECSNADVPKVTKTLLAEPSFQLSSLTFLLEENSHQFSLHYYKEYITTEEIAMIEEMLTVLTHYNRIMTDANASANAVDEDEMCTICFAFPISAMFEPCKHHSCQACITHHLMNCKNCFFCKTIITKVVDENGKVIYQVDQANEVLNSSAGGN